MPGLNQTGPMGQGPRSGRGFGLCATGVAAEGTGFFGGWGAGRGMCRGRGFARGYGAAAGRGRPGDVEVPLETSRTRLDSLSARIEKIEQSLAEIARQLEPKS